MGFQEICKENATVAEIQLHSMDTNDTVVLVDDIHVESIVCIVNVLISIF